MEHFNVIVALYFKNFILNLLPCDWKNILIDKWIFKSESWLERHFKKANFEALSIMQQRVGEIFFRSQLKFWEKSRNWNFYSMHSKVFRLCHKPISLSSATQFNLHLSIYPRNITQELHLSAICMIFNFKFVAILFKSVWKFFDFKMRWSVKRVIIKIFRNFMFKPLNSSIWIL